jgi:hypothetical protein
MLFQSGTQIYRGYADDPRNTDRAWTETTAFHFHCGAELGAKLQLGMGDDAGAVMWLNVDLLDARYRDLYGAHRDLVDRAASGMQDTWTAAAWLSSPSLGIAKHVSTALLGGACPANELASVRALGAATASEAALAERLRAGGLVEAMARALLPELKKLVAAGAATGVELHGKFVQQGQAFEMKYGGEET